MTVKHILKSEVILKLGDSRISAVTHQAGAQVPTFINVHDDEDTSVAAGLENIRAHGGRLIELSHASQRLITFKLNGNTYAFDPNRIFSDAGIQSTLKRHSIYSEEAHQAIKKFAAQYLDAFQLDQEPVIIALHNTVDGIFSVLSFLPNAEYSADAADAFVSASRSKFDFFYVTEREHFEFLKQRNFNVVLQSPGVTEDGSLSVYFAKKGVPYVNIEAQMSHLSEQILMVQAVREMLA